MQVVLIDTDVFSYFLKHDTRRELYVSHLEGKTLAVSFVTVGELLAWSVIRGWSQKRTDALREKLRSVLVIPFDLPVCVEYAKLCRIRTSSGGTHVLSANDRWIAACALRHGIPLVTGNAKHFAPVPGLVVLAAAPGDPVAPRDTPLPL